MRSKDASATSSRASSPGRSSSLSAQPSLHTLSMARLAQYRAGARTYRADTSAREGLSNGDVVAFREPGGHFYAVADLRGDPDDAASVHHAMAPAPGAEPGSGAAALEVVAQGRWLGFRAAAAGDRFLQARKRSPNRLVFYSTNVGTWEQWELAAGELGAAPWSAAAVTLRHRRLPQFELAVELVRLGACSLPPNAAITPRSLVVPDAAAAAAQRGGGELSERQELRKMSGVLIHEWLQFVDREKLQRQGIEQRVAQVAEDAADLRAWTVMQVDAMRREMDEEVTLLLETIERKTARLADAEGRLTGRLRWGVAMIQAKGELAVKRQVLGWWRWIVGRKRYCRRVEAKLAERANLRLQGRAMEAWVEHVQARGVARSRLRAAVRRMSFLKLHNAFAAWRELVAAKRQQAAAEAAVGAAVRQHMQRWRLRRLLGAWQGAAAAARQARALLVCMARRADRAAVAACFSGWREHMARQQERVAAFEALVALRQCQVAQREAFHAWRAQTEDAHGGRLQLTAARQVLARVRLGQAFAAWRSWQLARADRRRRWEATVEHMRRRAALVLLGVAMDAWQEWCAYRREQRDLFFRRAGVEGLCLPAAVVGVAGPFRGAVEHLALRKMHVAFQCWRFHAAQQQRHRAIVAQSVARLAFDITAHAWQAWRAFVAQARSDRHRVAVGRRRQALRLQRAALAAWREAADRAATERQLVALCRRRADRNRATVVLRAFASNARHAAAKRAQAQAADAYYCERLQARALGAMEQAVTRRRAFEQALGEVGRALDISALAAAFNAWRGCAALSTAEQQMVAAARRRLARLRLHACFAGWRQQCEERRAREALVHRRRQHSAARTLGAAFAAWQLQVDRQRSLRARLAECVLRVSQLRQGWALGVWRQVAVERAAERRVVGAGQRRIARVRLAVALRAWRQHTATLADARRAAEDMGAARDACLSASCLQGWGDWAAVQAQRRAAVMHLVARRTTWLMLNVMYVWKAFLEHRRERRAALRRGTRRLARLRLRQALAAWRGQAEAQRCRRQRLAAAGARLEARHRSVALRRAFAGWQQHAAALAAACAAVEGRRRAGAAVLLRHVLAGWRNCVAAAAARRTQLLRICVGRRMSAVQAGVFAAWQLHAQAAQRSREVMLRAVERLCLRHMRAAFDGWRGAARARRARRTAIARFMQRWDGARKAAALAHWRGLVSERDAARDNLRRCLLRKRVAFRLFRQWYWETFDEDMQETLRSMFEVADAAAHDPLPSRAGSPYGSLLSSPIKADLYGMVRQQQLQLTAGVTAALEQAAGAGELQPAALGAGPTSYSSSYSQQQQLLPQLAPRQSLADRLVALGIVPGGDGSPAPAPLSMPVPVPSLGGALAPLQQYAALATRGGGGDPLAAVPEAGESPCAQHSPYSPAYSGRAASGDDGSSAASSVVPLHAGSPLTPASAFVGASPSAADLSRFATPGASLAHVEAAFMVQRTPGGANLQVAAAVGQRAATSPSAPGSAARTPAPGLAEGASPGGLSGAPTPPSRLLPGSGSEGGSPLPAGAVARYSPYRMAGTPQPDFGSSPGGGPAARGAAASFGAWEAGAPGLADATTPLPDYLEGLQGRYQLRRMSGGGGGGGAGGAGSAPPPTLYSTPLSVLAERTPPPGFPELQGDYSIRRLSTAVDEEAAKMAAAATPDPADLRIGAAYPPGSANGDARRGSGGGGAEAGGLEGEDLGLRKTPVLAVGSLGPGNSYSNPLSMLSP
eukprot:scaffold1.g5659.t1